LPEPYSVFFGRPYSNYTLAIGLSVFLAGIWVCFRLHHQPATRQLTVRWTLDLYILMIISALVFGRSFYALSHFNYYSTHVQEIAQLDQGGLDWHGVVWSGCLLLWGFARWKHLPFSALLNAFAPALPILMFGAWWGCHASSCAYGAEIQNMSRYPSWLVWEGPDIYGLRLPRFYTQSIGTLLALTLLVIEWLLNRLQQVRWNRFALILAFMSLTMFGIGFMRGDDILTVLGLRMDQWMDLLMLLFAIFLIHRTYGTASKTGYDSVKQPMSF
jgi:prolipoprotein diacylglyceryltransferase